MKKILTVLLIFYSNSIFAQSTSQRSFITNFENASFQYTLSDVNSFRMVNLDSSNSKFHQVYPGYSSINTSPLSFNYFNPTNAINDPVLNFSLIPSTSQILSFTASANSSGSSNSIMSIVNNLNAPSQDVIIPPTPSSMSQITIGNDNVDLYSGKFNETIPIYEFNLEGKKVPIKLKYSTGGARVNEYASWVGLGWTLNAGGIITRTMKCLPDEFVGTVDLEQQGVIDAFGFLSNGSKFQNNFVASTATDQDRKKVIDFSAMTGEAGVDGVVSPEVWDTQPDEFNFSFPGYSGKFVFDNSGNIITIPYQELVINKTIANDALNIPRIIAFEVLTPDGFTFIFGDSGFESIEESQFLTASKSLPYQYPFINTGTIGGNPVNVWGSIPILITSQIDEIGINLFSAFNSSWYLKKIKSPNNHEINFNYNSYFVKYIQSHDISVSHPTLTPIFPSSGQKFYLSDAGDNGPFTQSTTLSFLEIFSVVKHINSITDVFGNQVNFMSNTNREDLFGDVKLDKIEIKSYDGIKRKLLLNHSYSQSIPIDKHNYLSDIFPNPLLITEDPNDDFLSEIQAEHKRMFLNNIKETNLITNSEMFLYKFEYDHTNVLPRITSTKHDGMGFYNNNSRGTTIAPSSWSTSQNPSAPNDHFPTSTTPPDNWPIFTWTNLNSQTLTNLAPSTFGGELSADIGKTLTGTMKRIVYQNGGSKEIEYDPNTQGGTNYGGVRVKKIKLNPNVKLNNPDAVSKNYSYGTLRIRKEYRSAYKFDTGFGTDNIQFNSNSYTEPYFSNGSHISYDKVILTESNNGSTEYEFYTILDHPDVLSPTYQQVSGGSIIGSGGVPFPPDEDNEWQRGILKKITLRNQANQKVKETEYFYVFNPTFHNVFESNGMKPGKYVFKQTNGSGGSITHKMHVAGSYLIKSNWYFLQKETTKNYFGSTKFVTEEKEYIYNPSGQMLYVPSIVRNLKSNGKNIFQHVKYNNEYSSPNPTNDENVKGLKYLLNKNIRNYPIETKLTFDYGTNPYGQIISGSLIQFFEDYVMPKASYNLRIDNPISFTPSSSISSSGGIDFFNKNINYLKDAEITLRDNVGNVTETKNLKTNQYISSIWDYNNQFNTATVVNSTYNEMSYTSFEAGNNGNFEVYVGAFASPFGYTLFESFTGSGCLKLGGAYAFPITNAWIRRTNLNSSSTYKLTFWSKDGTVAVNGGILSLIGEEINGWRYYEYEVNGQTEVGIHSIAGAFIDEVRLYPHNAQMKTVTYKPMIGITSICDENNKVVRYEYDDLHRLKLVRDMYGNIISKNEYHILENE